MRAIALLLPALLLGCDPSTPEVKDPDTATGTDTDSGGDDTLVDGYISVSPSEITLPTLFVGQTASETLTITNVGSGAVDATLSVVGGWATAYTLSAYTSTPAPGESTEHVLTLTPTTWGDHSVSVVVTDASSGGNVEVRVIAAVQEDNDGDGHGSVQSGGDDCNDADDTVNPGAEEVWYDGVDSDCSGGSDYDQDGDGVTVDTDCDDSDASVLPGATDTWYDGIDSDCAGNDDYDQDGDGYVPDEYAGMPTDGVAGSGRLPSGDCADTDATIHPGAEDTWYDSIDSDCAGNDDWDQDSDGYNVGSDCNDEDATISPGATETWYDGVDSDCAGDNDYDQDADGVDYPTDCNDTDPTVTGPEAEVFDGIDNDCSGYADDFVIDDVASGVLYGATSSGNLGDMGRVAMTADLTGDGKVDLALGASGTYGYVYVVDGATAATANGLVTSYDTATITGDSGYYPIGWVNGPFADVDGDGTDDLAFGGTYGYGGYGRSYLFLGGSGLSGSLSASSYDARFSGDSDGDNSYQAATGDIDGDGYADVVIGSSYDGYSSGGGGGDSYTGNVAVFLADEISAGSQDIGDANDQIHGDDDYHYLGWTLVVADVTGDGYDDILAGQPGYDTSRYDEAGGVFLFEGSSSATWDTRAEDAATAWFEGDSDEIGIGEDSLPHPGDVDGDGALDIGIPSEDEGMAWVFLATSSFSGSYDLSDADWSFTGTAGDLGSMMIMDSDLDGDGADDVVLGADGDDTSGTNAGAAFVYTGGSWTTDVATSSASATFWGSASQGYFGSGGAGGQDVDGDGREDVVIGELTSDVGASDGGAAWIVLGW
jgi:hypothetical protein